MRASSEKVINKAIDDGDFFENEALLGAIENASDDMQARIRSLVKDIVSHPEYRDEIVGFVRENKGIECASEVLNGYVEMAVRALDPLPDSFEKECLKNLAYFTGNRQV